MVIIMTILITIIMWINNNEKQWNINSNNNENNVMKIIM